ncbi:MAG: site-specific DNA-methyltransferase [Bacteroidia bacterium]|nr:site-specific DNA-methyltransferase [Bacteroidia bacterium]
MLNITNECNMELMARYPDKHFDLACIDPPYGLMDKLVNGGAGRNGKFDKNKDSVKWDILPTKEYFTELFRVSKNQIIWGGNYFQLPPTRCNLIWYKMQEFSGADFELAWTSFDKASKAFKMSRVEAYSDGKIHPCQKPVALYKWILDKYAKQGDKILDTHLGSGSSAIACHDYGFDLTCCELDIDYYNKAMQRIQNHISQTKLWK